MLIWLRLKLGKYKKEKKKNIKMNTSNKTLWLGNVESWMNYTFLRKFLEEINIFPKKISIKTKETKRGCAFLEFKL